MIYVRDCSEDRLNKVKKGKNLMNAIRTQKTKFINYAKKREQAKLPTTQFSNPLKKPRSVEIFQKLHQLQSEIKHKTPSKHDITKLYSEIPSEEEVKLSDSLPYNSLESVFSNHDSFIRDQSRSTLFPSRSSKKLSDKVSPGMMEYIYFPTFSTLLEEKKLKNLEEFFMEKYLLVTGLLDEHGFRVQLKENIQGIIEKNIHVDKSVNSTPKKLVKQKKPLIDETNITNFWDCKLGMIDKLVKEAVEKLLSVQKQKEITQSAGSPFKEKTPKMKWISPSRKNISSKVKLLMESDPSFIDYRKKTNRSHNTKAEVSSILQAGRSASNLHTHKYTADPSFESTSNINSPSTGLIRSKYAKYFPYISIKHDKNGSSYEHRNQSGLNKLVKKNTGNRQILKSLRKNSIF